MAIEQKTQKTTTGQDYLDTVAGFVANTEYSDIPEAARVHAKYVWMDTVGAILGGSLQPQATALAQRLSDGHGRATVLGPDFLSTSALNAALVNGTAGTFLELDEGRLPTGHPAIYSVPPILAVGEERDVTGQQLIEALVLSYEVTARLSWATDLVPGIHTHGNLGVIGAAVGVGRLLGYDARKVREAINVASCLNGATPSLATTEGALVRNVYAGFSGHMGVLVADLVDSGFTGLRDGPSEVYTRFIATGFDTAAMVEELGHDYMITGNYFKMHAACRHLHAPLDALGQALGGRVLSSEEVDQVRVLGNSHVARFSRNDPPNPLSAKFSIPFAMATGIVRNETGLEAFEQEAVDDPRARALAKRVVVEEDADYTRRWPQEQPVRVEVVTTSGQTLVGQVDNPRGNWDNPAAYEEVKDKFRALTSPIFRDGKSSKAVELFMDLERLSKAGDLTGGLRELGG